MLDDEWSGGVETGWLVGHGHRRLRARVRFPLLVPASDHLGGDRPKTHASGVARRGALAVGARRNLLGCSLQAARIGKARHSSGRRGKIESLISGHEAIRI